MSDENMPGYKLNKLGFPIKNEETLSSQKLVSRVAFKKPLSTAQRVAMAIRDHEYLKALDSRPGDDTFDGPDYESKTPHQLMTDPISGEELTAGEYLMLQEERAQAEKDVKSAYEQREAKKRAVKKSAAKSEALNEGDETE